jgi:hypothetical protein
VTISHVDMRAQAGYIRQCLARLSITILESEFNCDIQKLNEHVAVLEEGLAARGESSQDTMMNVYATYIWPAKMPTSFDTQRTSTPSESREPPCP